ncbi:HECT-like ubiquitin-conjugating enzyme-binding-domain-containing protein [Radiomyces spectabilis]|uniref:HECT-like ubiquitin-conjugating enzyme-binding-domain-containing protein n=1 Tax=Radiomyces spectabilis TaxID=64574 RepID=UPI0022207175|nr:HECT-like ubiquitin-conjugating enzyme-binding-domain-containing protein [Radiomyces spectabilis]KAI8391356.1 HECT-like ubiquitin-conjugating enzyme-binding-domain-containing protein [Radiomyces spectabilis]
MVIPFYSEKLTNIGVLRATLLVNAEAAAKATITVQDNVLLVGSDPVVNFSDVGVALASVPPVVTRPVETRTANQRVPIDVKLTLTKSSSYASPDSEEWWPAKEVRHFQHMNCRNCANRLLQTSSSFQCKDLPSEHWYELVECWICHETKPEEHRARMQPILARPDALLVGSTYFLVHPDNIISDAVVVDKPLASRVKWDRGTMSKWIMFNCNQCGHPIGEGQYEQRDEEIKLLAAKFFKYCVSILPSLKYQPTFIDFFVCDLLEAAKVHATHRFIIQGRNSSQIYALLWLFNWDTTVVYNKGFLDSSNENSTVYQERVMKVLYLDCSHNDDILVQRHLLSWGKDKTADHLLYPDAYCRQLVTAICETTKLLPSSMRTMNHPAMTMTQNFSVGFVNRN